MDKEAKEMLRSILKEELAPIHKTLDTLKNDLTDLKTEQKSILADIHKYHVILAEYLDDASEVLNKRLFSVETEIQQVGKQFTKEKPTISDALTKYQNR